MRRLLADAWTLQELRDGWQLAGTAASALPGPERLDELDWIPAAVPGTVSATLANRDRQDPRLVDVDARDWWLRTTIDGSGDRDGQSLLWFDGLATIAEVYWRGRLVLRSESMFTSSAVPLDISEDGELAICLRALRPLLEVRRRPRARWRSQLVREPNLRFFRTSILGRAPGLPAGPPVVGSYRPVVLQRRDVAAVSEVRLRSAVAGAHGTVSLRCRVQTIPETVGVGNVTLMVSGPDTELEAELSVQTTDDGVWAHGELTVADPRRWWPHTHGVPVLYSVAVRVGDRDGRQVTVQAGRVGFRDLQLAREPEHEGLALACNGVPVFARGAVWTPTDRGGEAISERALRSMLGQVVGAGMNMLRIPGISCYEMQGFYDLCDELGILVWQDFMFANLDYPELSADFMQTVDQEARTLLDELGHRPSLAVLCGGSEVAQQVAMLGLDPGLAEGPLYADLLPRIVREAEIQAPDVPSTPWGGDLPFRPDRGVANYYGVGAYLRPLEDARRAEVKFAAECLAFSNVPDETALSESGPLGVSHPDWKRGVPRDAGSGWDFEDVRDHYFELLYGLDAVRMRSFEQERYLELSRHASGEVMAHVFGEWRRGASACAGGLVLWLADLIPGAGWGLLDHRGEPKVAMHYLRRVLAPVAVWGTDEGLGGVHVHIANDGGEPLQATLRVALYRDRETPVGEATRDVRLAGHETRSVGLEEMLGYFADVTWAYRFGPPAQDLIVLSLEREGELVSQSFLHPVGRPTDRAGAHQLGLEASLQEDAEDGPVLRVRSRRFAYGVRVAVPGFTPSDDAFSVEPGHVRAVRLRRDERSAIGRGTVTALNLQGAVPIVKVQWP